MAEYVELRAPGDKPRSARVEEDRGNVLVVGAPPIHLGLLEPPAGTIVDVGFGTPGMRLWSSGVITNESGSGRLTIRLLDDGVPRNRREHVRVPAGTLLSVFPPESADPVAGRCIDVSESGLQAVIPFELDVGASIRIGFVLEDGSEVETTARVAHRLEGDRFGLAYELLLKGPRAKAFALALGRAVDSSRRSGV